MTWVAVAIGGSAVVGALSSRSAARSQERSAREGQNVQREMFNKQNELNEPFRQAGLTGQARYMELMGLGGNTNALGYGKYARDFGMSDFTADPGYQFRLDEGIKALNASAAARGGALSGANVKGAINYGQNAASAEYTNAYNRYNANRAAQLDPLYKLYAGGQAAASGSAAAANNLGTNIGNTLTAAGNAEAAGIVGGTNAINATIGNLGNQYMNYQNNAATTSYQNNLLAALSGKNMSATGY